MLVRRRARDPETPREARKRLLRALAAVDPRGSKEHHGVLDVLRPEAAKRLEILGEDPERAGFFAVEKFLVEIGERLH
jgi:hypothetical protein